MRAVYSSLMPQVAAITFHCDEVPEVRVRQLPFDDRVEVLVRFPEQRRAVVRFGEPQSIVDGLRCVASEVEAQLAAGDPVTVDAESPSEAEPEPA